MSDNVSVIWNKFFNERTKSIWEKFSGKLRALVVETNDPLNMGRVKFKCPELHDFDVDVKDCPWAVPDFDLGGKRAARFSCPVVGDWVWITFEKNHAYSPVWTGFATPTRRKYYAYPQISNVSPLSVDEGGNPADKPIDYDENYLPSDGRPMSHGWIDRYGHLDIHSSVGYYPAEHKDPPPSPDYDAVGGGEFEQQKRSPKVNNPDKKYMARVTKYGNIFLMGDQGYYWKNEGDYGEFSGNPEEDEKFETKRWLYVQKLLNDNIPDSSQPGGDQRKMLIMSRYGTRFEIRDVGWAQEGPVKSMSRSNEFGPPRILSKETKQDFRWVKIRTKGGMLFQAYDKGAHPNDDKFIRRPLLEESGPRSEQENKHWGGDKDARWIRLVTRHGIKFVLDDRGSDDKNADKRESPRGVGVLIKGRRTPSVKKKGLKGNPRGFLWEFNENDDANHTTWASPRGQSIEMNDRYQYTMMVSSMGKGWVRKYRGLKQNEFIRKPLMLRSPEFRTHHLKLDHDNEYVRFKTRGGKGTKPRGGVNPSGVGKREIQQGLEARDGRKGDGPWVEINDCQRRGMWFSKKQQLGVWRSKKGRRMYQWFDDRAKKIIIFNNEELGVIEIYANQKVNVISNNDINLRADGNVNIKAGRAIRMQAGGSKLTIRDSIRTNADYFGPKVTGFITGTFPGPGAGSPAPGGDTVERIVRPIQPEQLEPKDRGRTYNGPFEECPRDEVEHRTEE